MIVPSKRFCDLCKNPIDTSRPFTTMTYPLSDSDRELLAPTAPSTAIFPGIRALLANISIESYAFEFCQPCVDGILPMLNALKTEYLRRYVESRATQGRA